MKKFFIILSSLRFIYARLSSVTVFILVFINFYFKDKHRRDLIDKIFYAGAESRNVGGPYLKIQKLKKFFPENIWKFNTIYVLSNSPKLNDWSIKLIKERKIPLILNQNGVFYPAWYKGDYERQNLPMSKVYHYADYVFWQSNFCKRASDRFLGKRLGKGEILYNSVDTKLFYPNKQANHNIFRFLITGNIRKQNNYRIYSVVEAFQEIIVNNKHVHLYIAGIIEDIEYLKAEVNKLNISEYITFLGPYSLEDAPYIYQMADAYVTMSFQDNCPTAVIEAMACGLPILYSSSGGIPELVGNNCGIGLDVSEDWEKINVPKKQQIYMGLLEIMEKRNDMSGFARERAVKLFDIDSWIKRHKEVFEIFK